MEDEDLGDGIGQDCDGVPDDGVIQGVVCRDCMPPGGCGCYADADCGPEAPVYRGGDCASGSIGVCVAAIAEGQCWDDADCPPTPTMATDNPGVDCCVSSAPAGLRCNVGQDRSVGCRMCRDAASPLLNRSCRCGYTGACPIPD